MKYYIKVEKDVKILVEDINFDLGNPIMFVHGWPLNHNMYEYIIEYFASRGHRCIAIDLRGYGNSDKPYTGYDYDRMAMDIKLVIDALKLSDITLVGHSMGGAICLRYMSKFNEDKVSRLCLLSAVAPKWVQSSNWLYGYTVDEVNKLFSSLLLVSSSTMEARVQTSSGVMPMAVARARRSSFQNRWCSVCIRLKNSSTLISQYT